jgi:hypothetical protein
LKPIFLALIERGYFDIQSYQESQRRYELLSQENISVIKFPVMQEYLSAQNAESFLDGFKTRVAHLIRDGFELHARGAVSWELVFLALQFAGFKINWEDFNSRMLALDPEGNNVKQNFKNIFLKTKNMPIIELGATRTRTLDSRDVNTTVFDKHFLLFQIQHPLQNLVIFLLTNYFLFLCLL